MFVFDSFNSLFEMREMMHAYPFTIDEIIAFNSLFEMPPVRALADARRVAQVFQFSI